MVLPSSKDTDQHRERIQNEESTTVGTSKAKKVVNVDSEGATLAPISIATGIKDGSKDVATAGSRETLLSIATPCKKVFITAKDENTGKGYVGGVTVSSTSGAFIYAGDTIPLDIDDLIKIYVDVENSGEGFVYTYTT